MHWLASLLVYTNEFYENEKLLTGAYSQVVTVYHALSLMKM